MRYKTTIVTPNKPNNNLTFLLVLGTSDSISKLVSGFLSTNEMTMAVTIKTTKM